MAAALGGLDALVFTGGVGERSAPVRAAAVEGLGYLGVDLDPSRNEAADDDADLSARPGPARCSSTPARTSRSPARCAGRSRSRPGRTGHSQVSW